MPAAGAAGECLWWPGPLWPGAGRGAESGHTDITGAGDRREREREELELS